MTRYSASRGILYSAPPGPSGNRTESGEDADTSELAEEPTAEAEPDGTAPATADD